MKKNYFQLLLLCFLFVSQIGLSQTSDANFKLIKDRIFESQKSSVSNLSVLNKNVNSYLGTLDVNTGKWPDIDYASRAHTSPSWYEALERINSMTLAYTSPGGENYQKQALFEGIKSALNYFCTLKTTPSSTNWYYQGVSRPMILARIFINMDYGKSILPTTLRNEGIRIMCLDTAKTSGNRNNPTHSLNVGSNKSIIAMDWIMKGALMKNSRLLEVGAAESFVPIKLVTGDGIRYDLSYADHGDYLYTGSYGTELLNSMINVAHFLRGTEYKLQGERLDLFRKWTIESHIPMHRGSYIDWSTIGRAISRAGAVKRDYSSLMEKMQDIDPNFKSYYESAKLRANGKEGEMFNVASRNRHYFRTDYTLHTRPDYTFSVHPISSRTKTNEIGNKENILGHYLGLGATNIQLKGDEYFNIFPLWEWTYIPGTTIPDSLVTKSINNTSSERYGTNAFAGGVSDSLYAATGMIINGDAGVKAKKGWFMFDKEIVCLGAGITSTSNKQINTTINQALLRSTSFSGSINGVSRNFSLNTNESFNNQLDWIIQDNVGYVIPNREGKINLKARNKVSNWEVITQSGDEIAKSVENKNIFLLSINHGIKPQNQKYEYVIVPNIKKCWRNE